MAIVGLILCIGAASQPASGQPAQWQQSIERPSRGWDYDGKRILGHVDYDICLWDAATGKLLHKMKGHQERIHAVQLSPDGNHALSSSWMPPGPMRPDLKSKDTSTILWNLDTGRDRHIFRDQIAGEFSPDGKHLVTFSAWPDKVKTTYDFTNPETGEVTRRTSTQSVTRFNAAVWDTFTGRQLAKAQLGEHADPDWDTLHFSPDGRRFVHVVNGGFVLYNSSGAAVFNTSDGREIGTITRDAVKFGNGHRYTSNGRLASFEPQRARLIDLKSGRVVESVQHGLKSSWGQMWTHDGSKVVAIPCDESPIKIWNIKSGTMTSGAKNGPYPQRNAIISPDNNRLVIEWGGANSVEPGLGIYDMNTGKEVARIKLAEWGHMLGFSPDSKTLLVGGSEFVIYRSEDGEKIRSLKLLDDATFSDNWNQ